MEEVGRAALRNYRFSGLQGYLLIKSFRGFLSPCLHSQFGLPMAIGCLSGLFSLSVLSNPRSAALNNGIWYRKTGQEQIQDQRKSGEAPSVASDLWQRENMKIISSAIDLNVRASEGMGVSRPR